MGFTHAELFRTLRRVYGDSGVAIDGRSVRIRDGNREVRLDLSVESTRRLGSLSLPVVHVEFRFAGHTPEDVERFLEHFDAHFRKGGG